MNSGKSMMYSALKPRCLTSLQSEYRGSILNIMSVFRTWQTTLHIIKILCFSTAEAYGSVRKSFSFAIMIMLRMLSFKTEMNRKHWNDWYPGWYGLLFGWSLILSEHVSIGGIFWTNITALDLSVPLFWYSWWLWKGYSDDLIRNKAI